MPMKNKVGFSVLSNDEAGDKMRYEKDRGMMGMHFVS